MALNRKFLPEKIRLTYRTKRIVCRMKDYRDCLDCQYNRVIYSRTGFTDFRHLPIYIVRVAKCFHNLTTIHSYFIIYCYYMKFLGTGLTVVISKIIDCFMKNSNSYLNISSCHLATLKIFLSMTDGW